jgi:hypothetical protein
MKFDNAIKSNRKSGVSAVEGPAVSFVLKHTLKPVLFNDQAFLLED